VPREPIIAKRPVAKSHETLSINADYQEFLSDHALDSPSDFLNLEGEIISGHPDRHVMRVRIGEVDAILKREHRVPWKDRYSSWLDGFGWTSVSLREAAALQELHEADISVPEWMAAGEAADGRAFLLLRSVGPAVDLRRYLNERRTLSDRERRSFARGLAHEVAEIHNRGVEYPDLYAKHILIAPDDRRPTFLDWQRSRRRSRVSWRRRCGDLAALNASLADDLANPDDRFTFLLAYYRAASDHSRSFQDVCELIERRVRQLLGRSSIREQRLPAFHDSQTVAWLDGEALCVTPMGQTLFERERLETLAYSNRDNARIELSNGQTAILTCRTTKRRLGQVRDMIRQRRWTSPEVRAAADLLRRERLGEVPRLLAFGQRQRDWGVVQSFLLALEEAKS
jgi:tRNA A-37 threonylcarbamoyl transferase component Bud32